MPKAIREPNAFRQTPPGLSAGSTPSTPSGRERPGVFEDVPVTLKAIEWSDIAMSTRETADARHNKGDLATAKLLYDHAATLWSVVHNQPAADAASSRARLCQEIIEATSHQDDALIDLVRLVVEAWQLHDEKLPDTVEIPPEVDADIDRLMAQSERYARKAIALPARTSAGLRAKAELVLLLHGGDLDAASEFIEQAALASLCSDLIVER